MNERISRPDAQSNSRDGELLKIVRDAVEHVLARPDGRRGPFVITDEQIRSDTLARAS